MLRYLISALLLFIALTPASLAQRTTAESGPRAELAQPIQSSTPTPLAGFGSSLVLGSAADEWPLYAGIPNSSGVGSVETFTFRGTGWMPAICQIGPSTNQAGSFFGKSLATDGVGSEALLLVGEPGWDHNDGISTHADQGRVTVFRRNAAGCMNMVATIHPPTNSANQTFGHAIDIAVNGLEAVAVIGAPADASSPGAAYIYNSSDGGSTWLLQSALTPANSANGISFGWDVAIDGLDETPIAVASAPNQAGGRVYAFRRSGVNWPQEGEIAVMYGPTGADFGNAIDVSIYLGEALIVATCTTCQNGTAELFIRTQTAEPTPTVAYDFHHLVLASGGGFGTDVAIEHQPEPSASEPRVWMTIGTSSNYIGRWVYAFEPNNGMIWREADVFLAGNDITSVALGTAPNRSAAVVAAQPSSSAGGAAGAGMAWGVFPNDSALELLDNGGFERTLKTPTLQPWKQINKTKDKRKCTALDGCFFLFKSSANENSRLLQKVNVDNYQFEWGDNLVLTAQTKASVNRPNLRFKVIVKFTNGEKATDSAKVSALNWSTVQLDPIDLNCRTPSSIEVRVIHVGKTGKAWLDNISLKAHNNPGPGCRGALAAPVLPLPLPPAAN